MADILLQAEMVISILLAIAILLQAKSSGMGSMGGQDESSEYSTKRGAEKILHTSTVVLAVLFALIAIIFPFF